MDKLQRQIYFVRHDIWLVDGTLALLCTRVLCNEVLSSYLLGAQDRLSSLEVVFMAQQRHANHNRPADVQLA